MPDVRGYLGRHRAGSTYVALLIICFLFMGITAENEIVSPKRIVSSVASLAQRAVSDIGDFVKQFFTSIGELRQLKSSYSLLQEQLAQYGRDERKLIQLRDENLQLRSLLDLSERIEFHHVAAEVIANDPSSFFNAVVIDKGSIHGIRIDMPVVAFQDGFRGLVGRVSSVGPVSSKVLPLFDASSFVTARLQNPRYTGLVQGSGDRFALLSMIYVPNSAADFVSLGDLVATSGQSSIYPKDIYVGRVRGVLAKTWEASLTLELSPVIDFSQLEYVFVLDSESRAAE